MPFDDDFLLSKTKLVCACSAEDYEDDGNKNCLIRSFNRSLEQKESANKTEVRVTAIFLLVRKSVHVVLVLMNPIGTSSHLFRLVSKAPCDARDIRETR